jgi:hypothetical protein
MMGSSDFSVLSGLTLLVNAPDARPASVYGGR